MECLVLDTYYGLRTIVEDVKERDWKNGGEGEGGFKFFSFKKSTGFFCALLEGSWFIVWVF